MGNHFRPFSEASDRPEGQELDCEAVGGLICGIIWNHFQVDLRLLKMVSNDSPYPKTEPEPCL